MLDALLAEIKDEEGWRPFVYDDATGEPIVQGSTVVGYPTIGWGFCVDKHRGAALPKPVAEFWMRYLLNEKADELKRRWEPFERMESDVQRALLLMSYQLGVSGVLGFRKMLSALERGDRAEAAREALNSRWAEQTKARAERVAALIRG